MNVLDAIKANPHAVSKAVLAAAAGGTTLYFTLIGKPEHAGPIVDYLNTLVGVLGTVLTAVAGAASLIHWSSGPKATVGQVAASVTSAVAGSVPPAVTQGVETAVQEIKEATP